MQIGLIGLPSAGKTTLFSLLTGAEAGGAGGRQQVNLGMAKVPDPRLDFLAGLFKPRKITQATIQVTDLAGFLPGESDRAKLNDFLQSIRRSDALVNVIRTFEDEMLPHPLGGVDPVRDARLIEEELLLADLQLADSAVTRLRGSKKKTKEDEAQLPLLERCVEGLGDGKPVRELGFDEEQERLLRGYAFLTGRPILTVANLSEAQLRLGDYPGREGLKEYCRSQGEVMVEVCAGVELEITSLDETDRALFLEEYGLIEPGIARVARAAYSALGLISFLTAGEEEVRAWPVRQGVSAKQAAGKIHSDIEKGFIRAEVIAFADLKEAGSVKAARDRGVWRLEGRDYTVKDGDIITFRFNV